MPLRYYKGLDKAHRQHFKIDGVTVTYLETHVVHSGSRGYRLVKPLEEGQEVELVQTLEDPQDPNGIEVWVHHLEGDEWGRLCLGNLEDPIAQIVAAALERNATVGAEVLNYVHADQALFPDITLTLEIDDGEVESP